MGEYEIRIVKKDKGPITYVGPQVNDRSGVGQAQTFSREGDRVEVWRAISASIPATPSPHGPL